MAALAVAADTLGVEMCWLYRGDFHFRITDDITVSITPESAGRLRVSTWCNRRRRDRKWTRAGDRRRLVTLLHEALESSHVAA